VRERERERERMRAQLEGISYFNASLYLSWLSLALKQHLYILDIIMSQDTDDIDVYVFSTMSMA
jgi:hypothetical protein